MKTFIVILNHLTLQEMNKNNFQNCSRKMILPRWVIGCGYITLQTLLLLLRPLGRRLSSTIPIELIYCKDAVSISAVSMTYVLTKSLEKNEGFELYSLGGICHLCRDEREELQRCSCNGALGCGGYCEEYQSDMQALEKC